MSNAQSPLLQELARAADSHNIKDQLLVLLEREVIKDRQNMQNYYRLSNKLNEAINDIQMVSRLMVTAGEMQTKIDDIQLLRSN
ncbi:hypothetical protein Tco_0246569 [Tanacetum coccineum]